MLVNADARRIPLRDGVAQCVVTSPPYWGLRDYQVPGQIGLEEDPAAFVESLVEVFREVRRVLHPSGVAWINLGDCFASKASKPHHEKGAFANGTGTGQGCTSWTHRSQPTMNTIAPGLKPKDLVGMPWRVALALQADGWWLRRDVIWAKGVSFCPDYAGTAMPESTRDRPSSTHEYVFLLTKSERYFYDVDACREPHRYFPSGGIPGDHARNVRGIVKSLETPGRKPDHGLRRGADRGFDTRETPPGQRARRSKAVAPGAGRTGSPAEPGDPGSFHPSGRNLRSVWTINPEPYAGAHYATMPTALVRPCVLLGSPEAGVCPRCRAPWTRVVETPFVGDRARVYDSYFAGDAAPQLEARNRRMHPAPGGYAVTPRTELGWSPSCACGAPEEIRSDDLEVLECPTGARDGRDAADETLVTGRRGFNRERREDEGTALVTRFEQREHARRLRKHPERARMEEEAGTAFAHYARTDRAGARAIPRRLLALWIERGWLAAVAVPAWKAPDPVPALVLDPFAGSGTVVRVAQDHGRVGVGLDLSMKYLRDDAARRTVRTVAGDGGRPVRVLDRQIQLF